MSWNDFLPELALKHEVLESLYVDIGTPDNAKAKECQSLFDKFLGVINDHIHNVQQEKTCLAGQCEQMMDDIRRMTELVGQGQEGVAKLVDTLDGMCLWDRHTLLREEYTYIFEHYKRKLEEIQALHRELAGHATILGPAYVQPGPYPEEGASVTFDVVQQFSDNIAACEKEQTRRVAIVESTVITIKHLWTELGLGPQDAFDREIIDAELDSYPVSDEAMRRLEMKQTMLEDERTKRESLVKEHVTDITRLWDKLRIDDDEREEFMTSHVGLTMDTIRAYKSELSKLEELKSEKIQEFILDERDMLYELWDKLYYSLNQRESFTPVFDENYTDENFEAHEAEVARLRQEVEDNVHILNAIEQYRRMLDDIREFEITSMDVQRLFHRDPGRLLREEKFRKRMAREFPRVEKELEDALYEWQQAKGHPFLVYGEEYIKTMKLHAQQAREGKENEKLWREQRKHLSLQRDLRYGSQNPRKTVSQSPHPRRISPSLPLPATEPSDRKSPPPPPVLSSPQPHHTPSAKRIGLGTNTSRPGTPTTSHTRTISSFIPTTPTRSRAQTVTALGPNSLLQSPRSFQSHLQRQTGIGGKFYSRSESPATAFSLTKPASTPGKHNNGSGSGMRNSGPPAVTTYGLLSGESSNNNSRRSNSVISISSVTTDGFTEPLTPTRASRISHPISLDLTQHSIREEDDTVRSLLTPRSRKRTAADLSSPSHTPPGSPKVGTVAYGHRRKSRSMSPQMEVSSARMRTTATNSRAMDSSPFISKVTGLGDNFGPVRLAAKEAEQGNRFMKQLLQTEPSHYVREVEVDLDADMEALDEELDDEDSVVELDRNEAERYFSTPRKTIEVVEVQEDKDENESEGWETENEESPRSRSQSKNWKQSSSARLETHSNTTATGSSSK